MRQWTSVDLWSGTMVDAGTQVTVVDAEAQATMVDTEATVVNAGTRATVVDADDQATFSFLFSLGSQPVATTPIQGGSSLFS